jgi:hypothetical protein
MRQRLGLRKRTPLQNAQACNNAVDWLRTDDGGLVILALGWLLKARADEAAANSNAARATARQDAVDASAALLAATGATGVVTRQMLTDALHAEPGTIVDEKDFNDFIAKAKSPDRSVRLAARAMTGRLVADLWKMIQPNFSYWFMQTMFETARGRKGLLSPESIERVDPRDGDADTQRHGAIAYAGRVAGARYGEDGPIPKIFWDEAAESFNWRAEILRRANVRCDSVDGERFRQWCQRKTSRARKKRAENKLFNDARKEGARAEAINRTEPPKKAEEY